MGHLVDLDVTECFGNMSIAKRAPGSKIACVKGHHLGKLRPFIKEEPSQ